MDESTQREIEKITWQALKDAGITQPPVRIEDLLSHLEIDRGFYDLADPGLLRRIWHRVKVGQHQLVRVVRKSS